MNETRCPHCDKPINLDDLTPPPPDPTRLATQVSESIRVFWETKDWTAAQFRRALVAERLR
jgi:hypothetical protein